jgi:hypothetical protein
VKRDQFYDDGKDKPQDKPPCNFPSQKNPTQLVVILKKRKRKSNPAVLHLKTSLRPTPLIAIENNNKGMS